MSAVEQCRSAALGGHVLRCEGCGTDQISYNSCRNRHCPKCQSSGSRFTRADLVGRCSSTSNPSSRLVEVARAAHQPHCRTRSQHRRLVHRPYSGCTHQHCAHYRHSVFAPPRPGPRFPPSRFVQHLPSDWSNAPRRVDARAGVEQTLMKAARTGLLWASNTPYAAVLSGVELFFRCSKLIWSDC